ncbi:MAG: zinc-dependent metalloprotease [Planctomycetes bacterium]|nr:zinc-dependent metalloprotease [Planctomycetota bacterium]
MFHTPLLRRVGLNLAISLLATSALLADDTETKEEKSVVDPTKAATAVTKPSTTAKPTTTKTATKSKFQLLTKDAKTTDGLIKLHRKGNHLYAEIGSGQLNKDYIVLISIARGIGQGSILGGMSWGFGDDWIWQFRKVDDKIHIVRRNVRFTAKSGSPAASAVKLAYTDSVLFALPILTKAPGGASLVDLGPVFMSDLPQISRVLSGFSFSASKSTWAAVKGFKDNIELEVAATYASSGRTRLDTVADSRGATINVHYSISKLPTTGYKTRLADDRIGYFLTVIKDYSKKGTRDRFVRYVNRWNLQKADPKAKLSPPKKPIIFWLEKTVPFKYRKSIREGILEWNKAFEKAGFVNAIEVRQQPNDATWDPEDINYNTFRWITSSAGFAMGPSRVNPRTGQILDADIIFDADFLQYWREEYETFTPKSVAAMTGGPLDLESYARHLAAIPHGMQHRALCRCEFHHGQSRELALGATVIAARKYSAEDLEKLTQQALKEVTMHEVGHTLGLRHNFKASALYSLDEINDVEKTRKTGVTASVMDYSPANIAPKGKKQGDYYSTTIGPYDIWAIQYGYKQFSGSEEKELKKIASRSGEPALAYATDEDTRGIDPDPLSNRFDLGNDTVAYAKQRAALVKELMPGIVERSTKDGEGFQQARRAFGILLANHGIAMSYASRYVGGLYVHRSHKGDAGAKAPFVVVAAKKQREALALLEDQMFGDKPFNFPPEMYNQLAASRWNHWGVRFRTRTDYPIHEVIAMWQDRILAQLLSSLTLARLHDSELKIAADKDAFTTAELIQRLTKAIFAEVEEIKPGKYTNRKPAISSLRRNLQRRYLRRLSRLAMGNTAAPDDCQTIAYAELSALEGRIKRLLERSAAEAKGGASLDAYSQAHLQESADRIRKVLEAKLSLFTP